LPKSIYTERHKKLCELLRKYRKAAGLTQTIVPERLGEPPSYVAKYEGGDRRLDVLELIDVAAKPIAGRRSWPMRLNDNPNSRRVSGAANASRAGLSFPFNRPATAPSGEVVRHLSISKTTPRSHAAASPSLRLTARCGGMTTLRTGSLLHGRRLMVNVTTVDGGVIVCHGNAKPTDTHLASKNKITKVELRDRLLGFFHIPDQTVYAFFFRRRPNCKCA
jgi:hypothetical protein